MLIPVCGFVAIPIRDVLETVAEVVVRAVLVVVVLVATFWGWGKADSDLEARDDAVVLVAAKRDVPEDVGLAEAVVRTLFGAALAEGAVDTLGFLLTSEEAPVLPFGICELVVSAPPGFFTAPLALVLAVGPSVLSTSLIVVEVVVVLVTVVVFTPTLLVVGLEASLGLPAALLATDFAVVVALAGLSLATFGARSCFFFSSIILLFSAMASAFTLSFNRFSSIFFFLSASCCSLRVLVADTLALVVAALGFFRALASLEAAALLDTGLVVLPMAETGFFDST